MAKSAFQTAAEGSSSSGKPKNSVPKSKYAEAVAKLDRVKVGAKRIAQQSQKAIDLAGHAAMVGGGAYGAGYIDGRFGTKIHIMGKNPIPVVGIIATAVGIGLQVKGKRAGGYISGLGEGAFAAWAAKAGANMGAKNAAGGEVVQAPAPALPGAVAPVVGGYREVLLGGVAEAPLGPEPVVGITRGNEAPNRAPGKRQPAFVRVGSL